MIDLAKYKNEKFHAGHLFTSDGKAAVLESPSWWQRGRHEPDLQVRVSKGFCSTKHRRAACSLGDAHRVSGSFPSTVFPGNTSVQSHVVARVLLVEGCLGGLDVLGDGVRGLVEFNPHAFFTC